MQTTPPAPFAPGPHDFLYGAVGFALGFLAGVVSRFVVEKYSTLEELGKVLGIAGFPIAAVLAQNSGRLGASGPSASSLAMLGWGTAWLVYPIVAKAINLPMRRRKFRILEATHILILEPGGAVAAWTKVQKVKFLKDANEVVISKLAPDYGSYDIQSLDCPGITLRDSKGTKLLKAGTNWLYANTTSDVKKGTIATFTLKVNWKDTFTAHTENIQHDVLLETDKVIFEVQFPDTQRCTSATFVRAMGAEADTGQEIQHNGRLLSYTVPKPTPKIGESFRIDWNW